MSLRRNRIIVISLVTIITLLSSYLVVMLWWTSRYDRENFNCVDMSYKLAPILHNLGLKTNIMYGSNNDSAHAWLCVNGFFFDATKLWFDDEDEYNIDFIDRYPYGYTDEMLEAKGR